MRYLIFFCFSICLLSCKKPSNNNTGLVLKVRDSVFSSFDGTNIYYKDSGNGTPILFLHGFISNGSSWYETKLVQEVQSQGYRVIIPDMSGNGKSDRPQDPEAYQNNAEVKDLKALIDHLGFTSYQAVGYSRGSIILAQLLTEDKRISKAVIGGMGLDFSNPDWDRRIIFADAFSGRAPLNEMTQGAVDYATSINADLHVLGMLQDYQPATSRQELKQITTPVLLVAGNEDIDNGPPKELQEALGNATLKIVPGDHNTTYRKKVFADAVLPFLTHKE